MDTQGSQDSRGPPTRKKTGKGTAKTATSLGLTKSVQEAESSQPARESCTGTGEFTSPADAAETSLPPS